jgi:mono/diheme cytochrome c family protein
MASSSQKQAVAAGFSRTSRVATLAISAVIVLAEALTYVPLRAASPQGSVATSQAERAASREALDKYCVGCHNDRLRTAGLSLQMLDPDDAGAHTEIWEKVARKLRTREMPPPGRPAPDDRTYDALASALENALDNVAAAHPNPGRVPIHRLNRTEYANAVRDLIAVDVTSADGRALLPADDSGYGFDNIADVLSVSPLLMERYLSAARKIVRLAFGDPTVKPGSQTYSVPKYSRQDDRMSDDLPFASRGGIAVSHQFAVDGEYTIKVNLLRTYTDLIRGLREPHELEVRIDRKVVQRFTVGGPLDADGKPKSREQLNDELRMGDARLEVRIPVKAGPRLIGVSFVKTTAAAEGLLKPDFSVASYEFAGDLDVLPSVSSIVVLGPYNPEAAGDTPSRRAIFSCRPQGARDETACATKILSSLGRRAFRRPLTADDVRDLLIVYADGRRAGGFEAGIQFALQKVLVSPDFLFRIERETAGATASEPYRISDLDLASRLSFFLWSSIPDDELLDLAERGRLRRPEVLEQQVRRMLADRRSDALVENFGGQWLQVRNLRLTTPDPVRFPHFDENLREAFQRETELFLQSQLREDRSVIELLTADYTFVNERLARHYGIPNIYGNQFRRVPLLDENRRGLLGQGSILTVTSYANRTAPTIRGKWLLENILGSPPPPPPPNAPSLADETPGASPKTMRERMEQHRKNPVCASCHVRMDPLGFALENYDALGRWRDTADGSVRIDASGRMPDGTPFNGPAELRAALLKHQDQFVTALTEKLMTYALGRGVEPYDMPAVRRILRESAAGRYRWSSLILGIVRSSPFQMRSAGDGHPPTTTAAVP